MTNFSFAIGDPFTHENIFFRGDFLRIKLLKRLDARENKIYQRKAARINYAIYNVYMYVISMNIWNQLAYNNNLTKLNKKYLNNFCMWTSNPILWNKILRMRLKILIFGAVSLETCVLKEQDADGYWKAWEDGLAGNLWSCI